MCGKVEIFRAKQKDEQMVIFDCMLSVILPSNFGDIELQHKLDEWKRTGKLNKFSKDLWSPLSLRVVTQFK